MTDVAVEEYANFDFVSDAKFRMALASDYRELIRCVENSAWKSVHVLAGSIVEAILTDYLIGTGYPKRTGKDPLTMELGPIISACKAERIISDRTADLSSVVKSYRNLIHPGRLIRLKEKVDQKSASVAKALVGIVAEEVATAKASTYGFTAEQIVNKIEKDPSALAVLSHFLKDTNECERERVVKEIIPDRYFYEHESLEDRGNPSDYERCYRRTLATLSDEARTSVAKEYIKILKEESGEYVRRYETAFFRASDMKYLAPGEVSLAKAHLLSRLENDSNLLDVLSGSGRFLDKHEISGVVDVYAKTIASGKVNAIKTKARDLLSLLYYETEDDIRATLQSRVGDWIAFWDERNLSQPKAVLEGIKAEWAEEIPF
jgi:hypothetical protein